jgi:hypothetical protein
MTIGHIYCHIRYQASNISGTTKRLHRLKDYRFYALLIRTLAITGLAKIAEKCDTPCLMSSAFIRAFDNLFDSRDSQSIVIGIGSIF